MLRIVLARNRAAFFVAPGVTIYMEYKEIREQVYKGLLSITRDYKGLQGITKDYMGATKDYLGLQGVTRHY